MKRMHIWSMSLILGCGLLACQPAPVGVNQAQFSLPLAATQALHNYLFQVQTGFQVAAVDTADQAIVEAARLAFEADLKAGKLDSYQQNKHFSIQLLAGSEGNYFNSPELIQSLNQRVLATLVVMLPEQKSAIFKGEFENQRFYFADPSQQLALSTASKAYLMTADQNFAIKTVQGEILPDSQANSPTDAPASSPAPVEQSAVTSEAHDFDDVGGAAIDVDVNESTFDDRPSPAYYAIKQPMPPLAAYPNSNFAGRAMPAPMGVNPVEFKYRVDLFNASEAREYGARPVSAGFNPPPAPNSRLIRIQPREGSYVATTSVRPAPLPRAANPFDASEQMRNRNVPERVQILIESERRLQSETHP
jgi:hypothetical protein